MRKYLYLIIVLAVTVIADDKVLLQLKWKHSFQFAGFYMAKEKGFYDEVGLDVRFRELNSSIDLVDSVLSGEANYGIGDSSLIYQRLRGKKLILMMPILDSSPLALLTTKKVTSLRDFKSKTISINRCKLQSPAILSMLYISGIDMNRLRPKFDVFSVKDILTKDIDLYEVYVPNQPYYLKKRHIEYRLFYPKDYGLDFYGDILFTSENEIEKHFDRAIRFMDATKRGWDYALHHIEETISLILKKYNTQRYSKDELLYQAREYEDFISNRFEFNKQKIMNIKIVFKLLYKIKNDFDYNDFVLNRYVATKDEREFLKKHKNIKCISTTNWPPFNLEKNYKVVGMGIDYWNIVTSRLGIYSKCEIANNFTEVLEAIKSKKSDVTISTSETPDRKKYAVFSNSYAVFPIAIATKRKSGYIKDIHSIEDKLFALPKNHTATKLLLDAMPNIRYISTNTIKEALKLVSSGRAYATVDILPVLDYEINENNFTNLMVSGSTGFKFPVKFMVRKDYKELIPMINRVIDSIDEQTRKSIYNKWINVNIQNGYPISEVNRFLVFGGLIIIIFLVWIVILIIEIMKRQKIEKELKKLATYDKLTSIYNRQKIEEILDRYINILKEYKKPLSIIFFDIDRFKQINDTYGHSVGDMVLKEIAMVVSCNLDKDELFGRWGGEEFLIILPNKDIKIAERKANILRRIIDEYHFKSVGNVTCSFGVVEVTKSDTLDTVISKVDSKLYLAKKRGRNRVIS